MSRRGDLIVCGAGPADIEGPGRPLGREPALDLLEPPLPVFGEEERMMSQFRQFTLNAQQRQHCPGPRVPSLPGSRRAAAEARCQQRRIRMVDVCAGDDDVGGQTVVFALWGGEPHPRSVRSFCDHLRHPMPGAQIHTVLSCQAGDRCDDRAEPSARIQHGLIDVQMTHQVVEARCCFRRGSEEHRWVPEDLLHLGIRGVPTDEAVHRLEEQAQQSGQTSEKPRVCEVSRGVVGRIEQSVRREPAGLLCGSHIGGQ